MSEAIEALAEAWASLDGKLDELLAGRGGKDTEGDYHGCRERSEKRDHRLDIARERARTASRAGQTHSAQIWIPTRQTGKGYSDGARTS